MINSIFSRPKFIVNVILKSTPIILTALSVTFAFKTGLFNIGAEGQYIAATIASTIVGITFNFHPVIQIPLVIFSPDSLNIVKGAPSKRRTFIDMICSQLSKSYLINLQEYNKCLKIKNTLLKNENIDKRV